MVHVGGEGEEQFRFKKIYKGQGALSDQDLCKFTHICEYLHNFFARVVKKCVNVQI